MSDLTFPKAFWVLGTDTGIGKTLTSALLALKLKAHYWKPIQTGYKTERDSLFVRQATGLPTRHFFPERFLLKEPLSPYQAAKLEGLRIDLEDFSPPPGEYKHLIIEAAGGVMVPLNERDLFIDLIQGFGLPTLLVAKSGLGTLNHSLLTIEALRNRGIEILGLVLNGPKNRANKKTLELFSGLPVLFEIEPLPGLTPKNLQQEIDRWE